MRLISAVQFAILAPESCLSFTLNAQFSGKGRSPHRMGSLLTGRIFDSAGNRMTPSHANKKGVRYRYYISRALIEGQPEQAGIPARISAPAIEQLVIDALRGHPVANTLSERELIDSLLDRVDVDETSITLTLAVPDQDEDQDQLQHTQQAQPAECITIRCALGHAKPSQPRVIPSEGQGAPTALRLTGSQIGNTSRLISTIVRSQSWLADLRSGRIDSIQALARRDGRSERNVRMMLNLAFLSPEMIAAILDGSLPPTVNATDLAQGLPLDWAEQRRCIMGGAGLAS